MSKDLDIVFSGYLMQKSITSFVKKWIKVYVTINNGIIYVYSNKESKTANYLEDLAKYSIKITPIRSKPPYWVFQLQPIPEFSTSKLLKFGASSADEMNLCLKIIQKGIDLSRKIRNEENRIIGNNSIKSISTLPRKLVNTNMALDFPQSDIYDDLENQIEIKNRQFKSKSLMATSAMDQNPGNITTFPKLTELKETFQASSIDNSPPNLLSGITHNANDNYDNSKTNINIYNIYESSNLNLNNENYNKLNIDSIDNEHHQESTINSSPKLSMSYEKEINDKNNSNILQANSKYFSVSEDINRILKKQLVDLSIYASCNENSNQNENYSISGTIELETENVDKSIYDTSYSNDVDYSSESCIISNNNSNLFIYNQSNVENDIHNLDDNEISGQMNPSLNPQTDFQQDLSLYATYNQSNIENDIHNLDDNEISGQMNPSLNPQTDFQQDHSVYATYNQSNIENDIHNLDDNEISGQMNPSLNPQTDFQQDHSLYATYNPNSNVNINNNINEEIDHLKHLENNPNQTELLERLSRVEISKEDLSIYADYSKKDSREINFKNVLFIGNSEEAFKAISEFYVLGSFLVRIDNGKQILTVQGDECIVKYILIYNSNSNTIGIKNQKNQFENLETLLLYYFNNNLPNRNFKLTVPYKISGK